MKYFFCLLALFATTACHADEPKTDELGGVIKPARDNPYAPKPKKWEMTVIMADGEFVDFSEFRFRTRVECMQSGIDRMQYSLDRMNTVIRDDDGSILLTYDQYLGFLCKDVTKEEIRK